MLNEKSKELAWIEEIRASCLLSSSVSGRFEESFSMLVSPNHVRSMSETYCRESIESCSIENSIIVNLMISVGGNKTEINFYKEVVDDYYKDKFSYWYLFLIGFYGLSYESENFYDELHSYWLINRALSGGKFSHGPETCYGIMSVFERGFRNENDYFRYFYISLNNLKNGNLSKIYFKR